MASVDPCPCEANSPGSAPGPIQDDEQIIRLISKPLHIDGDVRNGFELTQGHWSKSDLKGKGRNASVLRACTPDAVLKTRAQAFNDFPEWDDDPFVATTLVLPIRQMKDTKDHRELCVYADPLTDQHGDCPTHGGIVRSQPGGGPKDSRTEMLTLIDDLCDIFSVRRLSDYLGSPVVQPEENTEERSPKR